MSEIMLLGGVRMMTSVCKDCGRTIEFNGKKWVDALDQWKCGNDPLNPVKSHVVGEDSRRK